MTRLIWPPGAGSPQPCQTDGADPRPTDRLDLSWAVQIDVAGGAAFGQHLDQSQDGLPNLGVGQTGKGDGKPLRLGQRPRIRGRRRLDSGGHLLGGRAEEIRDVDAENPAEAIEVRCAEASEPRLEPLDAARGLADGKIEEAGIETQRQPALAQSRGCLQVDVVEFAGLRSAGSHVVIRHSGYTKKLLSRESYYLRGYLQVPQADVTTMAICGRSGLTPGRPASIVRSLGNGPLGLRQSASFAHWPFLFSAAAREKEQAIRVR